MKEILKKVTDNIWEIPKETRPDMRTNARIYVSEQMLDQIFRDRSVEQLINVTTLPGIQGNAVVMPDMHEGYGFPIGGVAATDLDEGVISPGGIGYDINCGIRVLKSGFHYKEIADKIDMLSKEIYKNVPSGVGKGGKYKFKDNELDKVLNDGCVWAEANGFTNDNDLRFIESNGRMKTADSSKVSQYAKDRGRDQLGTMGSGNHFVEIDVIQNVIDNEAAEVFGLFEGQIVIQIHTGSRGLGHQVATDYIKTMLSSVIKYGIKLPDRELSCVPVSSEEGQSYFAAMSASANYAWVNRQLISHLVRESMQNVFGISNSKLDLLYDVAHNIAKIEEHLVNNQKKKVLVHRKGATRAFPANHPEVPNEYRTIGQPVLIPGSMGTASYILVGLQGGMENSFGSTCHGSGRLMSRTAALKRINGNELFKELNQKGIKIQTGSMKGLAEEAPDAYKNVENVVDVVDNAGLAKKVVRLKPLAVIKG